MKHAAALLWVMAAASFTLSFQAAAADCAAQRAPQDPVRCFGFIYDKAPYPEAHASTIVETSEGQIAAAWFGGTKERNPDVEIWFAVRTGGEWGTPRSVADGVQADGTRLPTWNPVLFQATVGPLHLFYKVGPNPREWWGMVITSDDDGKSWSEPRRLPGALLGPIKNKPVVLPGGTWLAPSSVETTMDDGWYMQMERSTDRGKSWTVHKVEPGPGSYDVIQPSILMLDDHTIEALGRSRQGVVVAAQSKDGGVTWGQPFAVDLPNPNSGTDAVTLADGRHIIVYNPVAQTPDLVTKGPRYPIALALSDDGVRWRRVLTLESEPLPSGYAYPAIIQSSDGMVHVTYTYDRRRIRHVVIDPARLSDPDAPAQTR